jgi:hypothetical protein
MVRKYQKQMIVTTVYVTYMQRADSYSNNWLVALTKKCADQKWIGYGRHIE